MSDILMSLEKGSGLALCFLTPPDSWWQECCCLYVSSSMPVSLKWALSALSFTRANNIWCMMVVDVTCYEAEQIFRFPAAWRWGVHGVFTWRPSRGITSL